MTLSREPAECNVNATQERGSDMTKEKEMRPSRQAKERISTKHNNITTYAAVIAACLGAYGFMTLGLGDVFGAI